MLDITAFYTLVILNSQDAHALKCIRVIRTDSELFKHAEAYQPVFRIIRRQHRQLGADRNAPEEFRLAAHIHNAFRHDTCNDELGTPQRRHEASLQQDCLCLDVEGIPIPLAQVSIVLGVQEHGCHPDVRPFHVREGIGQRVGSQVARHGYDRVRVRRISRQSIHNRENLAVFLGLNLGLAQINRTLDQIETPLLDLGELNLGIAGDLEQRKQNALRLRDRDDVLSLFSNNIGRDVRVFVVDRECAIRECFDVKRLAPD